VVRFHELAIDSFADWDGRRLGDGFAKKARVRRIQMLDEHKCHPHVGGEKFQQLGEGLEPPSRRPYSDDWEGTIRRSIAG
jgi:hypothetical protein